ncbi:hypothetical protein R0Q59_03135 [Lactobacillus johnsonii]|nr:hypothetical protein [Lactobacillus johnsonii]
MERVSLIVIIAFGEAIVNLANHFIVRRLLCMLHFYY